MLAWEHSGFSIDASVRITLYRPRRDAPTQGGQLGRARPFTKVRAAGGQSSDSSTACRVHSAGPRAGVGGTTGTSSAEGGLTHFRPTRFKRGERATRFAPLVRFVGRPRPGAALGVAGWASQVPGPVSFGARTATRPLLSAAARGRSLFLLSAWQWLPPVGRSTPRFSLDVVPLKGGRSVDMLTHPEETPF
jgi:hypothetical protein